METLTTEKNTKANGTASKAEQKKKYGQTRIIRKVAVLGSGIMGSRIAIHFANIGVQALLLDIAPKELTEEEKAKGLTLDSPAIKNRIVNSSLDTALKSNPSPVYHKSFAKRITTGNFTDHMKDIASCDWVIEVVVERLDIKKTVYEQVEKFRKPGTLITSNTSGIPMHMLTEGRSDDFRKNFCGTHFFNPPRYLALLEIIPAPETDSGVIDFLMHYGERYLGKTTVLCKDTPAFIANRVGTFALMSIFHLVEKLGLSVDEVDKLTGPVFGKPKSATFRTCDVVGLDTLVLVTNGIYNNCTNDKSRDTFKLPAYVQKLVDNKWFGDKTKQGFYKKVKNADGKSEILSLDLQSFEYKSKQKVKFATLEATKTIDNLRDRLKVLLQGKDKAGEFYRAASCHLFQYVSDRIPEIADELYRIDAAICDGFKWELGPFEMWDILGVAGTTQAMEAAGYKPAAWVYEMLNAGFTSFYKIENGIKKYYDIPSKSYKNVPGYESFIILNNLRDTKKVWGNPGATLFDIGDGVLNLEFHTKMNSIGGEIIQGINKGIEIAEKEFRGLVIGNDAPNFSAGANLAMLLMFAIEQEWDEIDMAVRALQQANMRIKGAAVPVVAATHGLALGGGCEIAMHAAKVQAYAETYIGLVEIGVGLIPAGGGTKEFVLRASDAFAEGELDLPIIKDKFLTIGMAKVATSAYEAYDSGILRKGIDEVTVSRNRLLADAKASVIKLSEAGYIPKAPRKDIKVVGRSALAMVYAGAHSMKTGGFISEYDQFLSEKLGYIISGGDLSAPTLVSEQYLLDLEREVFVSLCGQKKTLERMQSILTSGKPLRN